MLLFAGFSPVAAVADPVDVSKMDTAALRTLFHSPAFRAVCPLDVYSDDYTGISAPSHAALAPSPAQAKSAGESATSVIREMLRNPEFVSSDGLDTYGEEFVSDRL
jgi:hypothetical protein